MKKFLLLSIVVLSLCFISCKKSGSIKGFVMLDGEAIKGAKVTLYYEVSETTNIVTTTSNVDGYFEFIDLEIDMLYDLEATYNDEDGYFVANETVELVNYEGKSVILVMVNYNDNQPIIGKWECDIKALKGLDVDSSKETLLFNAGIDFTYVQDFYERKPGSFDKWQIKGKFERKNNKITFYERVKEGTRQQPEVTYKYEMEEGKTLTLTVEGEGYPDDKKVYKRIN